MKETSEEEAPRQGVCGSAPSTVEVGGLDDARGLAPADVRGLPPPGESRVERTVSSLAADQG